MGRARFVNGIAYVLQLINKTRGSMRPAPACSLVTAVDWQRGCPEIIPSLRARPFWDITEVPGLSVLQDSYAMIKSEFLAHRTASKENQMSFQPYRSPTVETQPAGSDAIGALATDRGHWNVCYLHLHGIDFDDNIRKCRGTAGVIEEIPRHYHHAFFSALASGTHVTKHHGPTNKKLRCQLPLVVPSGTSCWLRVGEEKVYLEEGKCIVFDDSFEHEASNEDTSLPRVVLIVDIWHPDLSDEEVKFMEYLNNAQMKAAKQLVSRSDGQSKEDFLSIILAAREAQVDIPQESIWGAKVIDD